MKWSSLLVLVLCFFSQGSYGSDSDSVKLKIQHMDCVTCPIVVKAALYDLDGVNNVDISMETKIVNVDYNGSHVTSDELVNAIKNAGFPAEVYE